MRNSVLEVFTLYIRSTAEQRKFRCSQVPEKMERSKFILHEFAAVPVN